jgi:hypothetical protein
MDALQSGRITGNPEVIAGSVSGNADVVGNASESTPNLRASGTLHLDRSRSRAPTSAGFLNRPMPHLSRALSFEG